MIPTNRQSTSPAEMLLIEFLFPRLQLTDLTKTVIQDILLENTPVTSHMAYLLSNAFGTTITFWLNMQANYDNSKDNK